MKDNHEVCWYCGAETMIKVSYWYKCSSCGATYVDPPKLREGAIEKRPSIIYNSYHREVTESLTPSKMVAKRAAKARAKKQST